MTVVRAARKGVGWVSDWIDSFQPGSVSWDIGASVRPRWRQRIAEMLKQSGLLATRKDVHGGSADFTFRRT